MKIAKKNVFIKSSEITLENCKKKVDTKIKSVQIYKIIILATSFICHAERLFRRITDDPFTRYQDV